MTTTLFETATDETVETVETVENTQAPETISEDTATVTTTEAEQDTAAPEETPAAVETPAADTTEPPKRSKRRRTRTPGNTAFGNTSEESTEDTSTDEGTGTDTEPSESTDEATKTEPTADTGDAGGITEALQNRKSAQDIAEGVEFSVDPKLVMPHPFNSPSRSQPQPGNAKWEELKNSIGANGNTAAARLVSAAAFIAERPTFADAVKNGKYEWVAVYGHRRRAACLETGRSLRAVREDGLMKNGGDLDALADENYGREDLTELEDARMLAFYVGVSGRALAKRLGRDQATISRRLNLLKTDPEIQAAVEAKTFKAPDAAILGSRLTYEPNGKKAEDKTEERRADQLEAFAMISNGRTASSACDWVIAARKSRDQATAESIEIIDPGTKFGPNYHQHECKDEPAVEVARNAGILFGALDRQSGALRYYTSQKPAKPEPTDREAAERAEAHARKEAQTARRKACVHLIKTPLPQKKLLDVFARQYNNGMAQMAGASEAGKLAQKWWFEAALSPTFGDEWREQMTTNDDPKVDHHAGWARAVAAFELRASATYRDWDADEIQYFDMLAERVQYVPTEWERKRLDRARQAAANATATAEAEAADEAAAAAAAEAADATEAKTAETVEEPTANTAPETDATPEAAASEPQAEADAEPETEAEAE